MTALRHYINRPPAIFDKYEAVELLQSLLRLARNENLENQQKADDYATALAEVKDAFYLVELAGRKKLVLFGLWKAKAGSRNYPRDPCVIYTQDTQEQM